ncbi:putative ATPase [Lipingzhangella halophila]|uniref:Putative ATPase n=1 Tax=Lipingzhangella halophila TaxID=1783352 RepID=A0A7W7W2R1_9ACTN|nr:BTAD domain-containing putative transcriptional regulator [Lipingzhangella halophila]MBB4932217.1 putative ATPase [Lipingzhangella halophila]
MRYSILGPLAVRDDNGEPVPVGGARLRRLLVLLLLDPERTVGTTRLIYGIWGDDAPSGASNALQALVSRLRRTLGEGTPLHGDIAGYRLDVSRSRIDLCEFEDLVATGRRLRADGDPRSAARMFGEALALWRGAALVDLAETGTANDIAVRLAELRRSVTEERLGCLLDAGDHHTALPEIEAMVATEPLRERPVELLMRALYACGRQADALAGYDRLRRGLAEELGVDPSAHIQQLHLRVLRGELRSAPPPDRDSTAQPVTRLPRVLTSFVAREGEVSTAVDLLRSQRLVTMIGPGGAGKTRLAIETGAAIAERAPDLAADGAWFVDLAPIGAGSEIPHAVLSAFGLRERSLLVMQTAATGPAVDPVSRIVEALASQSPLLILDNCEHVVTEAAELVERLLSACPELRILATSREPLAVDGERLLAVPSLALPPEGTPAEEVADYPAVQLFAERVAAASPGFTVDKGNAEHVARICRELDGMPLALELAAARVRAMPLAQLAAKLSDRFRLLTNGSRSALPRHQTLQAVVDWSWELLAEPERALLRRFSVFSGGASLDAVEQVCGDGGGPGVGGRDVWSVLFALVDKSLIVAEPVPDESSTHPRYRMLETVRAYAGQRLTESGEEEELRRAHAEHILKLWSRADPKLRTSEQLTWLARLRVEHDNFTAAQRWAIDAGEVELALDLYHAAVWYHQISDDWSDLRRRSTELLRLVGDEPPEGRVVGYVECLFAASAFAEEEGYSAEVEMRRVDDVLARAGILPERHETLIFLPVFQSMLGHDRDSVLRRLERVMVDGGPWLGATAKVLGGLVAMQSGRAARALDLCMAGLHELRDLGDRWGAAQAILLIVDLVHLSDLDRESDLLDEGVRLSAEIGATGLEAVLRCRRALVGTAQGRVDAAQEELERIDTGGLEYDALFLLRMAEAEVERFRGATARANAILRDVLRRVRAMGPIMRSHTEPMCCAMLARVAGDRAQSWRHAVTAWDSLALELDAVQAALVIELLAEQAHGEEPERAATLLGYAEAVRGLPNETESDVVRVREAVRERLGAARFAEVHRSATETPNERIIADIGGWTRERAPQE